MNSGKIADIAFEGVCFAIPSQTLKFVVNEIIAKGHVGGRARLGVKVKDVNRFQTEYYDIPPGAIIIELMPGNKLKNVVVGDVIIKVDGTQIKGSEDLSAEISKHKAGDKIKLTVYRYSVTGESKTIEADAELVDDKNE
jgi:serine protease Do